jgi:hypothetical protein
MYFALSIISAASRWLKNYGKLIDQKISYDDDDDENSFI